MRRSKLLFAAALWSCAIAARGADDSVGGAAAGAPPADDRGDTPFERLWGRPGGLGFLPYRQSTLMFSHTGTPNDTPTSQNPQDRVAPSYPLEHNEATFSFSLKTPVLPHPLLGPDNVLWLGYTQHSFWQALDSVHSRPFRESDYEPELIFSHRLDVTPLGELRPVLLNLGIVHQSNGQSDPRSRSWNRAYAQLGLVRRWSDDKSLALLVRPWWRLPEAAIDDNNPDIKRYMGYGDIECLFWHGHQLVTLLARVRALQVDFSTPLLLDPRSPKEQSLQLHLQLFTGYGESLIDYNQRHTTVGLGVSVPYGR